MVYAAGLRITVRGEEFIITKVESLDNKNQILHTDGISELVKGRKFIFDTSLEDNISQIHPSNTDFIFDNSVGYKRTKLFLESYFRNSSLFSDKIEIAYKAAIDPSNFQFDPTLKALKLPRPRILIADGVGLGKTIEVGILLSELIKRGKGQRILVIALKSILAQFQQEIWSRFSIPLVRLDSVGIAKIKAELPSNKNPFDYYDKIAVSIDTLKNDGKFKHYIEKSRWDIVCIDECHTVANSDSLRNKLAEQLSQRCESLILTSATPHNGKKESFANLIQMLEPTSIPQDGEFTDENIKPYFVRRFKKDIDKAVQENFKDREVSRIPSELKSNEIELLEYLHDIRTKAIEKNGKSRNNFEMLFAINLFKSYLSSPEACFDTLSNKKARILKNEDSEKSLLPMLEEGIQKVKIIIDSKTEKEDSKILDSKYLSLKNKLKELKFQNCDKRIIIFAERIATLKALNDNLKRDFKLNDEQIKRFSGELSDTEQEQLIDDFGSEDSKIRCLLCSDAGSQGVNLHYYCNIMFNYDIPWSIITLDQRNGRIDRYGQKNTPYIFYLTAQVENELIELDKDTKSKKTGIKTDLHIIEKLIDKEDEVHKSLGDAASLFKLFEVKEEENRVEDAIIEEDISLVDLDFDDLDFDFSSLINDIGNEVLSEEKPIEENYSFYSDDFDFYKQLTEIIKSFYPELRNNITTDTDIIEILQNEELTQVLYDLPKEALPGKGNNFKLTTNKIAVQKAIDRARTKKGDWPSLQLLYDNHPIVKWMINKLLATVDKDKALVCKVQSLDKNTIWFLFHGLVSNNLSIPVVSEFFVVGSKPDGTFIKAYEFKEFVEKYGFNQNLITMDISKKDIEIINNLKNDVIENATELYMIQRQNKQQLKMKIQLENYHKQLVDWKNASMYQLDIFSHLETNIFIKSKRAKTIKKIETILDEKSRFYNDMLSLDNNPYLKILGVFFN